MEKIRVLLEHWIEHNEEHIQKYKEWIEKLKDSNPEVSNLLSKAVEKFEEGCKILKEAYNILK